MGKYSISMILLAASLLPGSVMAYSISATFSGVASGGSVYRTISGSSYRVSAGQMQFDNVETDFPQLEIGPQTLYGWCVEPQEFIGYGTTEWQIEDLQYGATNIGGMGTQRANYLRELYHFVVPDFSQLVSAETGLALQIATWEIVRDNALGAFDLGSGNARFKKSRPNGAVDLAQSWLDEVINDGDQDPMLENLYAITNEGRQDMVVQLHKPEPPQPPVGTRQVPLPAPLWLLAGGIALLHYRRRKSA